jgi:hypothetical protein
VVTAGLFGNEIAPTSLALTDGGVVAMPPLLTEAISRAARPFL